MKHYLDIEQLRESDAVIGDMIRCANSSAFTVGDHIQITEKYDGSNASIENVDGKICAFSRRQELSPINTLNGFYTFIKDKERNGLVVPDGYVVFGEWSGARNKIVYSVKGDWFVFDIFDRTTSSYLPQETVLKYCEDNGLSYIHELYNGEFISWDHCRSFCHSPFYGDTQEGIVVKNQDKLLDSDGFFYLKIVNQEYKESKSRKEKREYNEDKNNARLLANEYMSQIVTKNRVEKELFKMRDDGMLGSELSARDMSIVAKHLPKRIFADCLKEEPEIVYAAGEYAGTASASIAMSIARSIILS